MPTRDDRITCAVCAWRGTCAKKFSKSGEFGIHCVDFTRDVLILPDEDEEVFFADIFEEEKEKEEKTDESKDEGQGKNSDK